jgi:type IV secretory pathway VirB2 component (pilin)
MLKSQTVRLIDVAAIGPAMVLGGYHLRRRHRLLALMLGFFGATTMIYNAYNYNRYAQLGQ